jgi:hypothetical protein
MDGSGKAGAHYRNLFLSRWALILRAKSWLLVQASPTWPSETRFFGVTNSQFLGAYAEYAVASVGMLAKKPNALSYVEAASVPVVAVTAWQALFQEASLVAGQTVVVHGAAGSVGPTPFSSLVGFISAPS